MEMIKPTTELTTTATKLGVIILFDANILNWLCWVEAFTSTTPPSNVVVVNDDDDNNEQAETLHEQCNKIQLFFVLGLCMPVNNYFWKHSNDKI
ncbi:hypothetical protein GQX74_003856 [Glossina fuscipes]|nr:hypothetical protein GQX74_003856 [Glossina fuscipes]